MIVIILHWLNDLLDVRIHLLAAMNVWIKLKRQDFKLLRLFNWTKSENQPTNRLTLHYAENHADYYKLTELLEC